MTRHMKKKCHKGPIDGEGRAKRINQPAEQSARVARLHTA